MSHMTHPCSDFGLTVEVIDPLALAARLLDPSCGAVATFEGRVRDHNDGRAVARLEYEAYEAMARSEGLKIIADAMTRFEVHAVSCVHRVGPLAIGDIAVWVGASAAHRRAALMACSFVIDGIKATVPIWKKEHYADGASEWVNCTCVHQQGGA